MELWKVGLPSRCRLTGDVSEEEIKGETYPRSSSSPTLQSPSSKVHSAVPAAVRLDADSWPNSWGTVDLSQHQVYLAITKGTGHTTTQQTQYHCRGDVTTPRHSSDVLVIWHLKWAWPWELRLSCRWTNLAQGNHQYQGLFPFHAYLVIQLLGICD